ncbi:MAG: phytanoyl-CoA dioxygenase family protein [Thermodesulfobacteriota bacterium]
MYIITNEQKRSYETNGYLLTSGLIAHEIVMEAAETMRRQLGIESGNLTSREDPSSVHQVYDEPSLLKCYTPAVCAVAAILTGYGAASFKPPLRAYAIKVFPSDGHWSWEQPHIDHALKEHGHRVFPPPIRIAAMIYLSDVPPHGGGTMVWPGSHTKLESLAKSDPVRYETMWMVKQDIDRVDLGAPVELTPRRGDVLFYHYLLAHAGSMNTSDRPRFALNMKWRAKEYK